MDELNRCALLTPESNVVLSITWAPSGRNWPSEVTLEMVEPLRVFEGRREVWLVRESSSQQLLVAKRFLPGKKPRREFRREVFGLKELARRGIRGPELQFTAEDGGQGLWVATRYIEDGESLSTIFHTREGSCFSEWSPIVKAFAETLVQHWRAGVYQADAHFDNFYWDGAAIYTLDVGLIQFKEPSLKESLREYTLYKMAMRFPESIRTEFFKVLSEVSKNSTGQSEFRLPPVDERERKIDKIVLAEGRRIWNKSFRNSSKTLYRNSASECFLALRSLDSTLMRTFREDPEALMMTGDRLKSGNTCTVQKFEWEGRIYILKRYNPKSTFYRIRHAFNLSRGKRSWANGHALGAFSIQTPKPLALLEQKSFGLTVQSYFLMECVEGCGLDVFFEKKPELPVPTDSIYREINQLFEKMHRYRVVHGDLKAKNLLVKEGQIWLIDTDGLQFGLKQERFKKARRKDIGRFLRNWDQRKELKELLTSALERDVLARPQTQQL